MANRPKGLKTLPSSGNGRVRKTGSFGIFEYQKEEIRRRAWSQGVTVSRYINMLLWGDWLQEQDRRVLGGKRHERKRNR
jgi:hypothetical protein